MPAQDGLRRHEGGELLERTLPDGFATNGKPAAFIIGQSQPAVAEFSPKNAVLLEEEVQDPSLVLVEPAGEDEARAREGWEACRRSVNGVAGAGSFSITSAIPEDPLFEEIEVDNQVLMFDPGGPQGLAASAGLAFTICH